MDFYIIPPVANCELMNLGDRFFCLAHLYADPKNVEYRDFFKKKVEEGCWVTLDNGAAESSLVTEDILLKICQELIPSEVIAPDVIGDASATIRNATSFYEKLDRAHLSEKIEMFFCPQGVDFHQYMIAYRWGLQTKYIKTIGWSKIAIPNVMLGKIGDVGIMEARHLLFDSLKNEGEKKGRRDYYFTKNIHLLGAGDPREFSKYKDEKCFRSSDSCFSVWGAMNDLSWEKEQFTRIPTPHDYFQRKVDKKQKNLVEKNVAVLKKLSN